MQFSMSFAWTVSRQIAMTRPSSSSKSSSVRTLALNLQMSMAYWNKRARFSASGVGLSTLRLPLTFRRGLEASWLALKQDSSEETKNGKMEVSQASISRPPLVRAVTTWSRLSKCRSFLRKQAASKKTFRSTAVSLGSDTQLWRSVYPVSATSSGCSGRSRSLATDHSPRVFRMGYSSSTWHIFSTAAALSAYGRL